MSKSDLRKLAVAATILLFMIPQTAATTHISRTDGLLTRQMFPAESQVVYVNQLFSFESWCANSGSDIDQNVVIRASDPWITGQNEYSLGSLNPGEKKTVRFTGMVPFGLPQLPITHSILTECIVQVPFLYSSSMWTVVVQNLPPPTEVRHKVGPFECVEYYQCNPAGFPAVLKSEQIICESASDPRCVNGGGIVCDPKLHSEDLPDMCADYFRAQGYIENPLGFPPRCVIATAAYNSPMAPEVVYMRKVRDGMIGSTAAGRILRDAFNAWYYSWAPLFAQWISSSETLRAIFRVLLVPAILIVHLTAFIFTTLGSGDLGAVLGFFTAALLSIGIYMVIPIIILLHAGTWLSRAISRRPARSAAK